MEGGSITRLLRDVEAGRPGAEDRLFARVYAELHDLARARLAGERGEVADGEAADMVHDAYQRVDSASLESRRHLFFAYARAMREILIDRARRNRAIKRGGDRRRLPLDAVDAEAAGDPRAPGVLEVADLLERLRDAAPREAQVVELRFFGGLSNADIATLLGVSERTVRSDWSSARTRLREWAAG